jgi:hypothetical protein
MSYQPLNSSIFISKQINIRHQTSAINNIFLSEQISNLDLLEVATSQVWIVLILVHGNQECSFLSASAE